MVGVGFWKMIFIAVLFVLGLYALMAALILVSEVQAPPTKLTLIEACEKAGGWRDACYFRQAIWRNDSTLCQGLSEDYPKACVAVINRDASACPTLMNEFYQDLCIEGIAVVEKNEHYCEQTSVLRNECFLEVATVKRNEFLCDKAGERRGECYALVAIVKKDATLCEEAGAHREECLKAVGSTT